MNLQRFSNRQASDAQGGSTEEEAREYRLQGDSIGVDESQFLRQCYWATRLLLSLSSAYFSWGDDLVPQQ
jgi:hypothetical protein